MTQCGQAGRVLALSLLNQVLHCLDRLHNPEPRDTRRGSGSEDLHAVPCTGVAPDDPRVVPRRGKAGPKNRRRPARAERLLRIEDQLRVAIDRYLEGLLALGAQCELPGEEPSNLLARLKAQHAPVAEGPLDVENLGVPELWPCHLPPDGLAIGQQIYVVLLARSGVEVRHPGCGPVLVVVAVHPDLRHGPGLHLPVDCVHYMLLAGAS
mmetsp:Transcript_3982/g.9135  ORF Transcript_3982/g.9135 Transcript_3982/m.9135 type:complete len:209 (-) Transcript_3982:830-1456(-)